MVLLFPRLAKTFRYYVKYAVTVVLEKNSAIVCVMDFSNPKAVLEDDFSNPKAVSNMEFSNVVAPMEWDFQYIRERSI